MGTDLILWTPGIRDDTIEAILEKSILEIRDVTAGEMPYQYTSGHKGPLYVGLKELISHTELFESLMRFLTDVLRRSIKRMHSVRFIAGVATDGLVPGYEIAKRLRQYWKRTLPFIYVCEAAKNGEWLVGAKNNPGVEIGSRCILVEELVNFGETTIRSVRKLRQAGYRVNHVACFLWYENPVAIKALRHEDIEVIHLLTLSELLDAAERKDLYPRQMIEECRMFLHDPLLWEQEMCPF